MRTFRLAFTLVELLLVIGVIAVLVGVLLAAMPGVVERSRRTACLASLQDVGRTLALRSNDSGGYLPLAGTLRLDPPPVTAGGIAGAFGGVQPHLVALAKNTVLTLMCLLLLKRSAGARDPATATVVPLYESAHA